MKFSVSFTSYGLSPESEEILEGGESHEEAVGEAVEEEEDEELVVVEGDTVVDPGAVVVKYLNAVVTDTAVTAAGWPVELTRHAPFHTNLRYLCLIDTYKH